MKKNNIYKKLFWIIIFGISMGYFEAAVVVYLRKIYYPEGFHFPLKSFADYIIAVELLREVASIGMLVAVAAVTGRKFWERFAYFILAFGVWDIFYYIFLKIILGWPATLFTWDILFLIPVPWIGPVIAPVSISLILIASGILIVRLFEEGAGFQPSSVSYILAIVASVLILYSFMHDTGATMQQQMPKPYRYGLLITGDVLFITSFIISYLNSRKHI